MLCVDRTKTIRWSAVIFNFIEVAAIIFYNSFLWERFILPYWSDYGKESQVMAYGEMFNFIKYLSRNPHLNGDFSK